MLISLILLALGLAADAFAVAVGQGAAQRAGAKGRALVIGLAFGGAQAVAPLAGWGISLVFGSLIDTMGHWIAFGLLTVLGIKMMREGLAKDPPGEASDPGRETVARGWTLVMLAIAVSIDAAAAGVTLPALDAPLALSLFMIGAVTFVLSVIGVIIGGAGAGALGSRAEVCGGLVLIGIGVKALIDHGAIGI